MNEFRQLWNGVWHLEVPQNETIQWIVECGLGELIVIGILLVPVMTVFAAYCKAVNWFYWTKPNAQFQARHEIVKETGNFAVYDMTDDELEALHDAECDF